MINWTDIDAIKTAINAVGDKVDATYNEVTNSTYGLAAIKDYLALTIKPLLDTVNSTVTTINTYVIAIEAKLDNETYGLLAIKTAVDNVYSEVTNSTYGLAAIKDYVSVINWTDITAIKTAVETDIPATLEAILADTAARARRR